MNASQKSEALRLADKYEAQGFLGDHRFAKEQWCSQAAVELRRLHARIADLEAQLADETEAADNWRRLALQFDHHRLQALGHLKAILHPDSSVDEYKTAELFLKAPPLDGESVLAQRIAKLSAAATQAQEDAQDTDRWRGIGKAIERACTDLPEETEIIVSLEKDAGTVTLIDQDGNEHENFSTDYGFAGVLNEAIDAAIAAQAKQGGQANG